MGNRKGTILSKLRGFTLLELLIVIGILAVLATTAVLVINPVEQLKQSRDGARIIDMQTLGIPLAAAQYSNMSMGAANTIYVSIPDSSSVCANLGLPTPPVNWAYACKTVANHKKIDGNGWIPVNIAATGVTSMASLPIDPINDASKGLYYTYVSGGSYAVSGMLESEKLLKQSAAKDGGYDPSRFELGSDLALLQKADGLAGYWPFDEGSGTTVNDKSEKGNNGTFFAGSPTWTTGKLGGAVNFNGSSAVRILNAGTEDFSKGRTMVAWFNPSALAVGTNIFLSFGLPYVSTHSAGNRAFHSSSISSVQRSVGGSTTLSINNWYLIAATYDGTNLKVYVNGILDGTASYPGTDGVSANLCVGAHTCGSYWTSGKVDEVRLYNRALSASEIQTMYNAMK